MEMYAHNSDKHYRHRAQKCGDFDWDEAVIYFAVTDRFFDGDTRK